MPARDQTSPCVRGDGACYTRTLLTEARHRLWVRTSVVALLILSLAPATGQARAAAGPWIDRCRTIFERCALVLQTSGAPLRWLPLALLAGGLLYAVADRMRVNATVTRFLRAHRLRRPLPMEPIAQLSDEFGCSASVHVVMGSAPNPAFTAGLLRPRVYVAETLQERLSAAELRAVVRHELYHLQHRDPLRFAILRFAQKLFFWIPVVGLLADDMMEDTEVMADDFAADAAGGGDRLEVASALVKLGRDQVRLVAGIASLGGFRLMDRRVRRLLSEFGVVRRELRVRSLVFSLMTLAALWLSSLIAPPHVRAAMTMGWRDRCPHSMESASNQCPECDHEAPGAMTDCER